MARAPKELSPDRPMSRDFRVLLEILKFLRPYRWQAFGATLALLLAAGTVLALGPGLKFLIDQGFGQADPTVLNKAVLPICGGLSSAISSASRQASSK